MGSGFGLWSAAWLVFFVSLSAWADQPIPACEDGNRELQINNQQVVEWKHSTPNATKKRANVQGPVTRVFPDHSGHDHFEIQIGSDKGDVLEVVYNSEFGAIPNPAPGMQVQACGDYITSIAQTGPYPPSPSGAIIHWIHRNPKGHGHEDGFLVINGSLYGQGDGRRGGHGNGRHDENGPNLADIWVMPQWGLAE